MERKGERWSEKARDEAGLIPGNHHKLDLGGCELEWEGVGPQRSACLSAEWCPLEKRGDRIERRTLNGIRQPLVFDEPHLTRTMVLKNMALFSKAAPHLFPRFCSLDCTRPLPSTFCIPQEAEFLGQRKLRWFSALRIEDSAGVSEMPASPS